MFKELIDLTQTWNDSEDVNAVVFTGAGRSYSAGGDIRSLYDEKMNGNHYYSEDFIGNEYVCHYKLATMIPIQICIFNGYVMGSGAGSSM